jgi:Protein of unknown function (DUF3179)
MGTARFILTAAAFATIGAGRPLLAQATPATQESGKVYTADQTGERWDTTQAGSLGFHPTAFQYGIGRNAFTPLDDSRIRKGDTTIPESIRVIGAREGLSHRAYSVPALGRHEVANSNLGGKPVAVGY